MSAAAVRSGVAFLVLLALLRPAASGSNLHIVLVLVDELGTGDVPWSDPQMHAPTIKALGEGGLRLGHQYAWHWCAPTRSALMSGRLPMHSGYKLGPQSGSQPGMPGHGCGLDLRLPLLPAELRAANFATHMLGKWHLGYRTPQNLPTHRGFDSYLGLLGGGSDHFQKTLCVPGSGHDLNSLCPCGPNPNKSAPLLPYRVDYWDGDGPAHSTWDNHTYDAYDFGARAVQLVQAHNASQNFFLYWAPHKVHAPLQAAPEFLAHYPLDPGHRCMSTPETCHERGWAAAELTSPSSPPFASTGAVGAFCNFTVDAGTGQGFKKGELRGGSYFHAVTPATDPVASASAAGCAALCCATDGCKAFSLNAPWSLPPAKGCQQNQNCCSLSSDVGSLRKNTYAMNITCGVVLAPPSTRAATGCGCSEMCYCNRRIFRAMLSSVDAMLTNLTSAMQTRGMWNDTLLFLLGDNGGPSSSAANNGEFKGMKFGHWEGGHRVPSFVAGPRLAPLLRMRWYVDCRRFRTRIAACFPYLQAEAP